MNSAVAVPEAISAPPARLPVRYGTLARGVLGWLFRPVSFPSEAAAPLRALAERTTLVYVLRTSSLLHLLYFNFVFWKHGLPLARAATGLGYRVLAPFARGFLGGAQVSLPQRGGPVADRATAQVVAATQQGEASLVFLRLPRTLPATVTGLSDPLPALVALQREHPDRPIALVPLTLLWRKRPRKLHRGMRDVLFGDPEAPGAMRALVGYLLHRGSAFAKVGEPVLLSDVTALQPEADTARVARRVRGFLHQHLAREARVVTGPPLKTPERVRDETLRDRTLRRALSAIAQEEKREDGSVLREARRDLHEIAARYSPLAVDILKRILDFVFNRIYDGVDVDEAGMRRLAEASARGPLVLCPCHKSHIDYMILSMVCDDYGLQPPHVAAGDNLNFWPVGRFLRMGGAFFIRRSFKGDRVYQATMAAYVKRLLRDGFTQEFFIEGGRSRTGKLLPPKLGMLALEVDAWLTGVKPDVFFAPISISYEKIAEARSYQRELLGGEKQKEDAKALLSATKVLRSRYGRITIRFDEPISLSNLFRERGLDPQAHTPDQRRALIHALGLRVAAGINRAAPLAPMGLVCSVLLSHDRRAISDDDLFARAAFLHQAALDGGARQAAFSDAGAGRVVLERALQSLVSDGAVRQQTAGGQRFTSVVEERRIALDYHKNAILHFLVGPAILAGALRSFGGRAAPLPELLARARELSRLFKHEFIYEPGRPLEEAVDETYARLLRWELVERTGDGVVPRAAGLDRLQLLAELLRPFGEGVWAAVDSLELLQPAPLEAREWLRRALDRGRAAYLAGRVRRVESLSKATLDNAMGMLRDRGVVELVGDGKAARLALTDAFRGPERLASLGLDVDRFLT